MVRYELWFEEELYAVLWKYDKEWLEQMKEEGFTVWECTRDGKKVREL